jgi:hypothetical protein
MMQDVIEEATVTRSVQKFPGAKRQCLSHKIRPSWASSIQSIPSHSTTLLVRSNGMLHFYLDLDLQSCFNSSEVSKHLSPPHECYMSSLFHPSPRYARPLVGVRNKWRKAVTLHLFRAGMCLTTTRFVPKIMRTFIPQWNEGTHTKANDVSKI